MGASMVSKTIAKLLLFLNALSFLLFTALILGALFLVVPNMRGDLMRTIPFEYRSHTDAIIYSSAIVLFIINVLLHGFIALIGACLHELERSRRILEEIRLMGSHEPRPSAFPHNGTPRL
jgi:uncharacterized membrane protein YobD (UPF0266 family)